MNKQKVCVWRTYRVFWNANMMLGKRSSAGIHTHTRILLYCFYFICVYFGFFLLTRLFSDYIAWFTFFKFILHFSLSKLCFFSLIWSVFYSIWVNYGYIWSCWEELTSQIRLSANHKFFVKIIGNCHCWFNRNREHVNWNVNLLNCC